MALAFLDANILVRHFTQDNMRHSPKASAFLREIALRNQRVRLIDTVVFETGFLLERSYKHPMSTIRANVLSLLTLPGLVLPGKDRFRRVFDYYVDLNIPVADGYHAVIMEDEGITDIVTFDRKFDRVPSIRRVEP
ncbi:MAG: PIN domain-containing protein [Chloroflexota bacterium]|nr:PIN domain-containing protein [Chloroflexota bacterium]